MDELRNDIERYLSGKMTSAERHALEKRALNDPFLADAIEGAESISADEFSWDVNQLNQQIVGAGKNRWLWPLRMAASVIGVAIVGSVIYISIHRTDSGNLASSEQKSENKLAAEARADSVQGNSQSTGEQAIAQVKPEEKKVETKPLLPSKEQSQSLVGGSGVQNKFTLASGPELKPADSIATETLLASTVQRDTISETEMAELVRLEEKTADNVVTAAPTQQPIVDKKEKSLASGERKSGAQRITENTIITGQVRDQSGEPLPGVNINVKGTSNGAVTNAEGKYAIALPNSDATLVYTFIGFVSQEMKLDKSKDYADVQLMEDATQLSEVVVTGYGEKRTDGEPIVRLAEPIGGRKAYDKYLEEGKIYPQQALENKVEGKVVIEFTVSTVGTLSDFHVIKKLGFGCDEEVIRLVREGAAWRPSYIDNEPAESLVRIKTRFTLPKK